MPDAAAPKVLILACGALAREMLDVIRLNSLDGFTLECLPVGLHNRPAEIPEAVRARIRQARPHYDQVFVGYGDCGTGGRLDAVLAEEGAERLPGAHCYEFFAGIDNFDTIHDAEPGTFYLTDYLVKHFDRVVIKGLGIDRHPELLPMYFGNYTRLMYLSQVENPELVALGRAAADRLGLRFEHRPTGYGDMERSVVEHARGE